MISLIVKHDDGRFDFPSRLEIMRENKKGDRNFSTTSSTNTANSPRLPLESLLPVKGVG